MSNVRYTIINLQPQFNVRYINLNYIGVSKSRISLLKPGVLDDFVNRRPLRWVLLQHPPHEVFEILADFCFLAEFKAKLRLHN